MTRDDARTGVLLVRAWMHDGQLIARVHTWATGEQDQQADVVVGEAALIGRVRAWVAALGQAGA